MLSHLSFFFSNYDTRCVEADRDIFDWSGKKPLDYQKQLTTISSSTFSSEYFMKNVIVTNIQTLPTRQNTMKKLRNKERSVVQRSFTIMNDGARGGSFDAASPSKPRANDNFDTKSLVSEAGFDGETRRKEKRSRSSFLKKSMSRKQRN